MRVYLEQAKFPERKRACCVTSKKKLWRTLFWDGFYFLSLTQNPITPCSSSDGDSQQLSGI